MPFKCVAEIIKWLAIIYYPWNTRKLIHHIIHDEPLASCLAHVHLLPNFYKTSHFIITEKLKSQAKPSMKPIKSSRTETMKTSIMFTDISSQNGEY